MDPLTLVVQSRFAGLSVDDQRPSTSGGAIPKQPTEKKEGQKKRRSRRKKKAPRPISIGSEEQWELWKLKDEQFVQTNFQTELKEAIMLSKQDYAENREVYAQRRREANQGRGRRGRGKRWKKNSMSLEEFNALLSIGGGFSQGNGPKGLKAKDPSFFKRLRRESRHEFIKDKINDRIKGSIAALEAGVKYLEGLEKTEKEVDTLKTEVAQLKKELAAVNNRNKTLCQILAQGEMMQKADMRHELDHMRVREAELTAEIETLHSELEKERTKNTDLRVNEQQKKPSAEGGA